MIVLDREKLILALKGQYRKEKNIKTAWTEEVPNAVADFSMLCVEGLQPLQIPIPKQVCISHYSSVNCILFLFILKLDSNTIIWSFYKITR